MTRERFAPMGGIDRDGIRLVTSGGGRAAVTRTATKTPGKTSRPAKSGPCTVIHLPIEQAPSPSIELATDRRNSRTRRYVEALVGWLLIFGTAYLALLLIGG